LEVEDEFEKCNTENRKRENHGIEKLGSEKIQTMN